MEARDQLLAARQRERDAEIAEHLVGDVPLAVPLQRVAAPGVFGLVDEVFLQRAAVGHRRFDGVVGAVEREHAVDGDLGVDRREARRIAPRGVSGAAVRWCGRVECHPAAVPHLNRHACGGIDRGLGRVGGHVCDRVDHVGRRGVGSGLGRALFEGRHVGRGRVDDVDHVERRGVRGRIDRGRRGWSLRSAGNEQEGEAGVSGHGG